MTTASEWLRKRANTYWEDGRRAADLDDKTISGFYRTVSKELAATAERLEIGDLDDVQDSPKPQTTTLFDTQEHN